MVATRVVEKRLQVDLGQRALAEPRHRFLLACARMRNSRCSFTRSVTSRQVPIHPDGSAVLHDHRRQRLDPMLLAVGDAAAVDRACDAACRCAALPGSRRAPAPDRPDGCRSATNASVPSKLPCGRRWMVSRLLRPGDAVGCDVPRPDADLGRSSAASTSLVSGKKAGRSPRSAWRTMYRGVSRARCDGSGSAIVMQRRSGRYASGHHLPFVAPRRF